MDRLVFVVAVALARCGIVAVPVGVVRSGVIALRLPGGAASEQPGQ